MTARLSIALLLATCGLAQVHRYGRFETRLTASRDYDDPLALEVRVEFTGPGGVRDSAPAFWDGGRDWIVRYMPERAGEWKYRVQSADAGLARAAGAFKAGAYRGDNALYRHGPVRVAADRRHFEHADGTPWFWLACTGWNSALQSTPDEWRDYLNDRASKRFTAIQFVMTQWRAGRRDEQGRVAFRLTGGRLEIDPAFFRRMDERFDTLNSRGLAGVPVLLWALTSKDNESPGAALSTAQAIALARYMVARYGAHHVLWLLGGDGDYSGSNLERWKTIGRGVFPASPSRRPVSLHPGGMRNPWRDYLDESWLDYFVFQSGHGSDARKWKWNATEGGGEGWKFEPPRPVLDGEPNYEGHLSYQSRTVIDDAAVRRAVYYSLLAAPPAGVTYGAHGIWYWSRKAEVPLDHPRTGVALPWRECLNYPGALQMRVMRDVFDSVEWWKLRPDRTLLAEDPPDPTFVAYPMPARSTDGRFALIYLPANPNVRLNLAGFRRAVASTWIDPRTGERKRAGDLKPETGVEARAPGPGDWILLLSVR
ncbi:MAG: DUF4038 domain-containing protein [Bryobacteraceae bacterium]